MPIPVSALIASPRRLLAAILLFVALDLSVLVTNLWIAHQVAEDAVAINMAGRQRMLSQRMTKSLLLAANSSAPEHADLAAEEFISAYSLFNQTLEAFAHGGQTLGGDGKTVQLHAVDGAASEYIAEARRLLKPLTVQLVDHAKTDAVWAPAATYMVSTNVEILQLMNRLTSRLEHDSVQRTEQLRVIQTLAFLLALGNFIAIVIGLTRRHKEMENEKEHWQQLARHDALTGLTNRKGFFEAAERVLSRAQRESECGALFLLDLDGFKPINDTLGHPIGDHVLKNFGDRLQSIARQSDVTARLGGDEFVLLCPGLQGASTIDSVCERIVDAVRSVGPMSVNGKSLGVSIGVAHYTPDSYDINALIAAADRAMYEAKRSGSNLWRTQVTNSAIPKDAQSQ
ncbi:diguanylate cyclase domain-containing protein [Nitrogeniibacter aestuarii]|uniref:diguanylate cyclase domain-containing protein n=1 Tax=Nitrogeniibacter aestuarii TaxID=2815343 RepID=UPI001E491F5F|nr:diguanylate cyclase [Nitrogeniibacter aestuarii]